MDWCAVTVELQVIEDTTFVFLDTGYDVDVDVVVENRLTLT